MKLLIAIVNNEDSATVSSALTRECFTVTKLSTTGGFLMVGNTTLLIGATDESIGRAKEIIKENSQKRIKKTTTVDAYGTGLREDDFSTEIPVGGAIVFTIDVESMDKY